MKYYKIIQNNNFIGVACSNDFKRYQLRHNCYVSTTETYGEFISYNGKLYRSTWMPPVPNESSASYEQAIIIEITEEEYNIYYQAIENNEEIIVNDDDIIPVPEIIDIDPFSDVSIEFVRSSKINEMSYRCKTTIEAGIDIEIHGEKCHFSLTTQDQLNLMSLSTMAQTQTLIPYHADEETCTFYTNDEINLIVKTATEFKIYQTTYYNALKAYINSLETIEEIAAIEYGIEIPDEYKTDVLKILET